MKTRLSWWLLLGLVVVGCKAVPVVGPAQTVTAQRLGGGEQLFDPAALVHPTLLVFWASWCASCKAEVGAVLDIDRAQRGRLDVIGVSVDEHADRAEGFARDAQLPYLNLFDPRLVLADQFNVKGTPSFVLLARGGQVLHTAKGVDDALLSAIALAVQ